MKQKSDMIIFMCQKGGINDGWERHDQRQRKEYWIVIIDDLEGMKHLSKHDREKYFGDLRRENQKM